MVEPDPVTLERYEETIAALGYEPVGFNTFKGLTDWVLAGKEADIVLIDHSSFLDGERVGSWVATLEKVPIIMIGQHQKTFQFRRTARHLTTFCKNRCHPRLSPMWFARISERNKWTD
uniref:hypothetical protein n=1 Tax=Agrobacterium fabrum TaxID=1176649 RepID=UPI00214F27DD|nr:hypothetical protein [Agrobacterium fabrum]